jgi:hypothetical protein
MRIVKSILVVVGSSLALASISLARTETPRTDEPATLDCSDPGRSCSVGRNCCSGSCVHGNCR